MSLVNKIYALMPSFIQDLGISVYGYYWHKRRFGGIFTKEYEGFRVREKYFQLEWENYQEQKLREILLHSYQNVPYYRKSLAPFAEMIPHFKLRDLEKLPILEKDTLRRLGKTELLADQQEKGGDFYSSSGSTGTPTQIKISPRMHQLWTAGFEARIRNWAGVTNKTPRGTIGGRRVVADGNSSGPFYRYNIIEKQVYFSAYHISDRTIENYVDGMYKHKIEYMTGYAMSNYFLARFIEEKGLKAPQLKAVITSSEKLTPEMRATFKRVYGCKSYDSYSGVEDCGMITECEHRKLHISPDLGILEVMKENGEYAMPGETGELICTGILNYDQPLIRYRIGDTVKVSRDQTCLCGRNMPIIEEIIGRIEDTVIGPDGREIVRFHGIFIKIPEIIEGQIIQHKLEEFEIKIVTSQKLKESSIDLIRKRMRTQLGEVNIKITDLENIPRNQNGKFKAVVSNVNREKK
jgi:phenylacetate-CoA ligase